MKILNKINDYIKLMWIELLELCFGRLDEVYDECDEEDKLNLVLYMEYSNRDLIGCIILFCLSFVCIWSLTYSILHLFSFAWVIILFGLYIKVKLNNKNKK